MIKVMVVHKISTDFKTWKKFFDEKTDLMKQYGAQNYSTGTLLNDPKNVYVLGDFDSEENFKKMWNNKEMQDTIKKSGVIEEPHVTILREIEQRELVMQHAHH